MKKLRLFSIMFLLAISCCLFSACGKNGTHEEKIEYSITFNSNGGTEVPTIITDGTDYILPNNPSKKGYEFVGWYLDNGSFNVLFNADTINKDIIVYAKWKKPTNIEIYQNSLILLYERYDNLDLSNAKIIVNYDDYSSEIVNIDNDMISGFNNTLIGAGVFTINYKGLSIQVDYRIKEPTLIDVSLQNGVISTRYIIGDNISLINCKLIEKYSDNSIKLVLITEEMIEGFNSETYGNSTFTIKYKGYQFNVDYFVDENPEKDNMFLFKLDEAYNKYIIVKYVGNNKELIIPKTYKGKEIYAIDNEVFKDHTELEKVSMSDNILQIGSSLFYNCLNLKKIRLSSNIKVIKTSTFYNCSELDEIVLPEELITIDTGVFINCSKLNNLVLPPNTIEFKSSLKGCTSLSEITLNENLRTLVFNAKDTKIKDLKLTKNLKQITGIPGNTTLESIFFPGELGKIPANVCSGCTSLQRITICDGITEIEKNAFYNCQSLRNIFLPSSLNMVRDFAFKTGSYKEVYFLGENVVLLDVENPNNVFDNSYIHVSKNVYSKYNNYSYWQSYYKNGKIMKYENLSITEDGLVIDNNKILSIISDTETVKIPEYVSKIEQQAFRASNLTSIIIPNNVESIGSNAFKDCLRLKSFYLTTQTGANIGASILSGCNNIEEASLFVDENINISSYFSVLSPFATPKSLKTLYLTEQTETIPDHCFDQTGIEILILPTSISKINYTYYIDKSSTTGLTTIPYICCTYDMVELLTPYISNSNVLYKFCASVDYFGDYESLSEKVSINIDNTILKIININNNIAYYINT